MNWLKNLFAERPWPLLWVLALGALILVISAVATGRGKFLIGVWALAGVAALLLIVEWLWETDRERVDKIIDNLAQAVRREDADEIARSLAPECHFGDSDRDGIRSMAESIFRSFDLDRLTISGRRTEVSTLRKEATAEFLAVVRGRQGHVEFNPYPTRWILTFGQTKTGEWQVVDIQRIAAFGDERQPIDPFQGSPTP